VRVAVLAFDGFDELDAFVTLGLLNRLKADGVGAQIASPAAQVTSMHGVTVHAQQPLEWADEADAVVFASGLYTRAIAANSALLDRLQLDPLRQSIGAVGPGALLLARLGLLAAMPACADAATKPWVVEAGVRVVEAPFHACGPVATAAGPMAAVYLATWLMVRGAGRAATRAALLRAAPVGEQDGWAERALAVVTPFLPPDLG
jgi:transcriptional regulator GlxA family with amidase domain